MRLIPATSGAVRFAEAKGEGALDLLALSGARLRAARRNLQMVFQDPHASLNPRMTVFDTLAEPLVVHGVASGKSEIEDRVRALMRKVGLSAAMMRRYPHEFSGGQRQRVGIARAIALEPKLVLLDEPVSALDVSIQAQILNLLDDLQQDLGLAYVFVAHDLAVVRHISREVAVMYLGRIVERAPADALFEEPLHPYTQALLSAIPTPDPTAERSKKRLPLVGEVPSPLDPPAGCHFHPRCPRAEARCRAEVPELREVADGRRAACHLVG
jgi:oligopeptide/dipeptide ABC transporter ATP-binding protein